MAEALTVIHSLPNWLPLTATWLYNQVRYLPPDICSHVACEKTEHLDQFAVPNIHCFDTQSRQELLTKIYYKLRLTKLLESSRLNHLVKLARDQGASILHSHWGDVAWRDLDAAKRAGLSHVVTFYGKDVNFYPQHPVWQKRYQDLFHPVSLVLCEGTHMARCIVQLGCPEEKVRVHHLGVEVDKIAFVPRVWKKGPLRVLLVGSFREKKGFPDALRALGLLQGELPGLEITIIGDSSLDPRSQPEKALILDVLAQCKLNTKTRLLGYQPHRVLFEEAYKHHIFISPSLTAGDGDTEGGAPVTLIEMAATGMPIVSTVHCDIPSIIIHRRTGLLAEERDVNGLLQHLRWYVNHAELWDEMLRAGRQHVEAEYNVVKQGNQLGKIYASLPASQGSL